MEEFLAQLAVSTNNNIEELPRQFARVLSWMHIDPYSQPDVIKIRVLLKSALFLHGNLRVHGYNLEQKLKECQIIPKNELASLLQKFHSDTMLSDVCQKILMTATGPNHIHEIQDFCHDFLDPNKYLDILSRVREARCNQEDNEDRIATEAKFLITTTFQLKSTEELELAIERIVDYVEFDVLAWIINLGENSTYFALKCLIVQDKLCLRLENGLVSRRFIDSMYEVAALSEDGLRIYLKCLQNRNFASSLIAFVISYLSAVEAPKPEQAKLMEHDNQHVSFLIAGLMSKRSDCRIEFHKKLAAMSLNVNVLFEISHLNFFYEL